MEHDLPEETLTTRSDLRFILAQLPLFRELAVETVRLIAAECVWLSLPGGATLFEAGDSSDAMYVLLAGGLATVSTDQDGRPFVQDRIVPGETVGEMGVVSGRSRSASVVALRDSELLRLSAAAFDQIFKQHPEAMLSIARLTVSRLEATISGHARAHATAPRTFAVVPHNLAVDVVGFATALVAALRPFGKVELVWSVRGADHTSHWFDKIEAANDFVVYVADHEASSWSKLCIRQADAHLLIANATDEVEPWPAMQDVRCARVVSQHTELILLHDDVLRRAAVARWLQMLPGVPFHHVLSTADVQRVARLLTGNAVGLVLSGGGARGFAHLGVVKALREHGVPIDLVGGTSIGAIMGAAVAHRWDDAHLLEVFRRTFVDSNPLADYTWPIVSLVSGRRVSQRLRKEFGDTTIEDLPLPFYCVSTNLTRGTAAVHRSGELWRWLRASVAIPGVLPPVMSGGEVFVDGATINNLPVDIMRDMRRGRVIGVDVAADRAFTTEVDDVDAPPFWKLMHLFAKRRRRPNILQVLWRSGMVNSTAATAARREQTDLLLQPALEDVDLLNWRACDRAIQSGYAHAMTRLAGLSTPLTGVVSQ
ncbi:MAG: patatin-like phospholipase family protein [Steroidobacteraceae bacterium]|nr:patatin-like phospholipase family protein [Steroidobacteraceae bacterium]